MGISNSPTGLIEGRIVHYIPCADDGFLHKDRHIAAVVVRVWDKVHGTVNLRLFLDGDNDHPSYQRRENEWKTSVKYDDTATEPRSWHYPERAEEA